MQQSGGAGRRSDTGSRAPATVRAGASAGRRIPLVWVLTTGLTFVFTLAAVLAGPTGRSKPASPPQASVPASVKTAGDPAWVDVVRPFHMFDLSGGDYARLPLRYVAKRDATGSARRDTLTYGDPIPGQAFLRLTVSARPAGQIGQGPDNSVFVDAARSAAETGVAVLRSGLPSLIETNFGPVETAEMTLASGGAKAVCLGFRLVRKEAGPLALFGIGCGRPDRPLQPVALACALDKLDLVSAGDDDRLQRFFADAERRRGAVSACDGARAGASGGALRSAALKGSIAE